jgi:peptidoglycan/LPS O-acetylase OafA/YrhL
MSLGKLNPEFSKTETLHLSGLNGLRALAAISVVISHVTLDLNKFGLNPFIFGTSPDGTPRGLDMAAYGVSMFFALSGFLITYLLLIEKETYGIDVKKFYVRRILRIWPLYYLYLILAILVAFLYHLNFNFLSFVCYFFYAANIPFIMGISLPFLNHYWSLGVEEQFYLFWPWFNKFTGSYIIICIIVLIIISVKILLHYYFPGSIFEITIHITRFHCMMIGAIGAILYIKKAVHFFDNKLSQLICWSIILLIILNKFHFISVIDNEIISMVTVILIIGQINVKNRIINLETKIFDFLGKLSYCIYIIHPLLIFLFSKILNRLDIHYIGKYILVYNTILGSTILLSYLSFIYFENIFMNLKRNYTIIRSSSTMN